jgi:hypothetical protein
MLLGLCILGLALLVGTSASQEKKDKVKGILPPGWKDLNLSAAQKEKVYEINAQFKVKIDELQKQIKGLETERKKAQVAVLNEEQKELLAKITLGEAKKKEEDKKKKDEKKPADK